MKDADERNFLKILANFFKQPLWSDSLRNHYLALSPAAEQKPKQKQNDSPKFSILLVPLPKVSPVGASQKIARVQMLKEYGVFIKKRLMIVALLSLTKLCYEHSSKNCKCLWKS